MNPHSGLAAHMRTAEWKTANRLVHRSPGTTRVLPSAPIAILPSAPAAADALAPAGTSVESPLASPPTLPARHGCSALSVPRPLTCLPAGAMLSLVTAPAPAPMAAVATAPVTTARLHADRATTLVGPSARTDRDIAKRVFDVVGALLLITLLLPIWAVIAILIKYETPGRVFFVQTRIGKDGRPFRMFKFRSMVQDAEHLREALERFNEVEGGILFKMRRDPRVTRLGHVLRRSSLDETPQLLNILRGDMSIVGPRPPVPAEVALYTPAQRRRLEVMPGLTCLWQVSGRSLLDFDDQVALDVEYIEKRSLLLDLWILIKTIPAVIVARGAF